MGIDPAGAGGPVSLPKEAVTMQGVRAHAPYYSHEDERRRERERERERDRERDRAKAAASKAPPAPVLSPSHMDSHAIYLLSRVIFCERFFSAVCFC
jgi:hypothetical protein